MENSIIKLGESHIVGITSLQIAEVTGKRHSDVMRDIRSAISNGASERNFALGEYKDKNNQSRPMYNLTPKGCLILASGYDVVLREKIIDKLEEYQQKEASVVALPDFTNPAEAARAWAEQFELKQIEAKRADEAEAQVLMLTNEIEKMEPKVSYYDAILASKNTVTTTQVAQDYGLSAIRFNKILEEMRIQRKVNGQWILYAPYIGQGYVHSKPFDITRSDGRADVVMNTEWTQKGRLFLYERLKMSDILPLIEQA